MKIFAAYRRPFWFFPLYLFLLVLLSAAVLPVSLCRAATYNIYGGAYASWPTAWIPVPSLGDHDNGVEERLDFVGDTSTSGGDGENYAFYKYNDGTYVYFRVRVDTGTWGGIKNLDVGGVWTDNIWIMIDGNADGVPDYALAWDSNTWDAGGTEPHGLEFQVRDVIASTWSGVRFDDIDRLDSKKLWQSGSAPGQCNGQCGGGNNCWHIDIPYTGGTGYVRVDDGQPTTTWGSTMFIDIAVRWSYLVSASTKAHECNPVYPVLSPFGRWKLQMGSRNNANDHAAVQTDVGGDSNPDDSLKWSEITELGPECITIKSVKDENGGNVEPGDALLYRIVIQNQSGLYLNDAELKDTIPTGTNYVASSVTHPAGSTVVSETPVLDITGIDVPAHSQVSITFRVRVESPLDPSITEISNQGTVFYDSNGDGTNDAIQLTDGDTAQPGEQATVIPVTAGPNFDQTSKAVALQADADGNGVVSPEDTLRYTVAIKNTGDQNATGVTFSDPVPIGTTYVPGSVTATGGSPLYNAGSTQIEWTGNVAPGSSVMITFDVTVNVGIMVGTVISNQGTVNYASDGGGTNDSTVLTDGDPAEPGKQPTEVMAGEMPEGVAIKSVKDENGGNVEPGDALLYTIVFRNLSGYDVTGIEFTDAIPANTSYVASSVTHPAGSTVVSETPVLDITGIDVPAHGQVMVTFRALVDSSLPAGVTQVVNQGTVFYDSNGDGTNDAIQLTDGDTAQPGEQATVIPVTARPISQIPTINEWGVIIMFLLLAVISIPRLKKLSGTPT